MRIAYATSAWSNFVYEEQEDKLVSSLGVYRGFHLRTNY